MEVGILHISQVRYRKGVDEKAPMRVFIYKILFVVSLFTLVSCQSEIFKKNDSFETLSFKELVAHDVSFNFQSGRQLDPQSDVMVAFGPSSPKQLPHVQHLARTQANVLRQYVSKVSFCPQPASLETAFNDAHQLNKPLLVYLLLHEGPQALSQSQECARVGCQVPQTKEWLGDALMSYSFWVYATEGEQLLESGQVVSRRPLPKKLDERTQIFEPPMHLIVKKIFGIH